MFYKLDLLWGFSGGSDCIESACNPGDLGLIPGLGRPPGEGNGEPFQYFCLEKSMDRGAWWSTAHGVTKSQTQLSDFHLTSFTFHMQTLSHRVQVAELLSCVFTR